MSDITQGEWRLTAMPDSDQLLIETDDYVIAECNEVVEQDVTNFRAIVYRVNNYEKLVTALRNSLSAMESDLVKIHGEWGVGGDIETLTITGDLTEEIIEARTLLAALEAEKGGEL